MKDKIIEVIDSPRGLEDLYRAHPREFAKAFPGAFAARPDSPVLQAWQERLFYAPPAASETARWQGRDVGWVVVLSLLAGTLIKLPHFFSALDEEWFYARNLSGILAGALIAYFCIQKPAPKRVAQFAFALLIAALLYLNLLPDRHDSHTIILACLHTPFFLWSLLGVAFLGGEWKNLGGRMDYLRYNGELLIYTTMIWIGGMVMTGLTIALFDLIQLHIENWYLENVVVYGAVAAPIVATLLVDRVVGNRFRFAPLLAKIFTPLFLVTVVSYLAAMALQHKSPFTDREFLIAFNGLLLVVLGLCVFSISERGGRENPGLGDYMNIGLVSVTLMIDVVALSAILFRLTSYGFTPNRVAVLGANLLAFGHLAGILLRYLRFILHKDPFASLEQWIVTYLPAYSTWSILVAVGFPLIWRLA